ncbi:hypothetical protein D6D24_01462 [Aureobasidium pullulans]|uniref:Stealth protein CR2 conserved region 2 domain-containing protein n=1 Tax=Aureobasidium pullulans TaxID=5580 RepID=A0A4S8WE30_AURPU|nr:hypothetical protein D6D24_01462 [Aureobasidium pullulans]
MPYLQQKDSTWQTRRSSSSFTRFTRSRRRQLLGVFSVLCILIYWTVCIGLGSTRNELFTPPLPATPKFWAGGSEDRLVTIQASKGAFVTDLGDVVEPPASQEIPRPQIFDQVGSSEEPILQERPATIQVTKGSSVNDIGDVEEQQSLAEDVSEMQPVVADGGRLTDISKSQAGTQADNSQDSASLSLPGSLTDRVKFAMSPGYVFPDTSNFERLNRLADELPDYVHIPLHMAVREETLDSWEEDWFAHAVFEPKTHGSLKEPKIDFVYTWVNGSDTRFAETMRPYELNSSLNDDAGEWIASHGVNRYRDWDELRYSIRSVEKHAGSFRNNIQILVNAVEGEDGTMSKQRPTWLKDDVEIQSTLQVLSQEDFFGAEEAECLPTFNSLTIENQIYNTPSDTDRIFAMSDDMFLGKPHAASDIYSPLFGTVMGFKPNSYNTIVPPSEKDALRFGEKPYLIYTSWMLNRRFGTRKRKGQVHFGHSLSRSVYKEAMEAFPRPALKSACQKFRGETGFQLYSWYNAFHYTIERHREALLWSYIMIRSDPDRNGYLNWEERQAIVSDLEEGLANEGRNSFRKRMYYYVAKSLGDAGLEAPKVNVETTWTSLDGPATIANIDCFEFNVNECLAPGFSSPSWDERSDNPVFSTAAIFDRLARQDPQCGDCLTKLLLNRVEQGLSPLLPHADKDAEHRQTVLKALKRYSYVVVEPDALFTMVTDAEQVQVRLIDRLADPDKQAGQLCLNDDVTTDNENELLALRETISRLFNEHWGTPSRFEAWSQ